MMDISNEFQLILDKAIESEPLGFTNFDRTKNVQDQLQEMVGGLYDLHYKFHEFLDDWLGWELMKYDLTVDYFTSWEQLWLAFVMLEKHSKEWNGEDWVQCQ